MEERKKPEDQNDENPDRFNRSDDSEDSFGLPDIEYKTLDESKGQEPGSSYETPADTEPFEEAADPYASYEGRSVYTPPEEEKSKAPLIIGLVVGVIIILAGFLVYNFVIKPQREKERQEQLAKQKKAAQDKAAREKARLAKEMEEARQKAIADSIAAANVKPAIGVIETLSERTRRYYVVISSAIDDDLLMDYAKKLSKKGVGIKIIPPFSKTKFYRLTIADHDSYASAQSNAEAVMEQYGSNVWVVRY